MSMLPKAMNDGLDGLMNPIIISQLTVMRNDLRQEENKFMCVDDFVSFIFTHLKSMFGTVKLFVHQCLIL